MLTRHQRAQATHSALFDRVLSEALLPLAHLDGNAKRALRLVCKTLRDAVDVTINNVAWECRLVNGEAKMAAPKRLAPWAANVSKMRLEFCDAAWIGLLNSTNLPKLTHLTSGGSTVDR